MLKLLFAITVLILVALLVRQMFFAFPAQKISDYSGETPLFDIREAFQGTVRADGMIYGPDGRVTSRFHASMVGRFGNTGGVIEEEFQYATGRTQSRVWNISIAEDGTLSSTAPDIVGTAQMEQSGNALRMRYRLRLPEDAGGHVLDVTDWIYLMPDGTMLNRSQMRKFGIKVAELFAVMRRVPEETPAE